MVGSISVLASRAFSPGAGWCRDVTAEEHSGVRVKPVAMSRPLDYE
jgi:hypothetical protein